MNCKIWINAARPKTLPAGIIPVITASALAFYNNKLDLFFAFITLLCSILIQISTNLYNEIYDYKRGADDENRLGPIRQVASGVISIKNMFSAAIILTIITFCLGMVLVFHSGFIILVIGILSIFFSFIYTGGPYPLAYKGLGDLFVFLFFGVIAVNGAYFVQTNEVSNLSFFLSLAPGLLSANILNVNNIRDIETDKKAGKITLAIRLGLNNSVNMYILFTIISYSCILILYFLLNKVIFLIPFLSIPLTLKLCIDIKKKKGKDLNSVLSKSGLLLLLFGLLNSISFILAR